MACGRGSGFAECQEKLMLLASKHGAAENVMAALAYSTCRADLETAISLMVPSAQRAASRALMPRLRILKAAI